MILTEDDAVWAADEFIKYFSQMGNIEDYFRFVKKLGYRIKLISECLVKFKKLIFEGPKYLLPRIEGIEILFFSTLVNAPEKLFHVAFSLSNFSIVCFVRQEKLPNLIE